MSSTIRLQWRDNSTNETQFNIYRGTSLDMSDSDIQIAQVIWNGSTWDTSIVSTQVNSLSLISSAGGPSSTGMFVIEFEEPNSGEHYYGVSAYNPAGESDVVSTLQSTTID